MAIRIICPACKTLNALADDTAGQKVRCPKCDKLLLVPTPKAGAPKRDAGAAPQDRKGPAPKAAPPKRDAAAIQEDRKVKVKSDAAPERKRERPERDDADPGPRKLTKPVKKAFPVLPVALGGAGLFVLLIAGLGVAFYAFRAKPDVAPVQAQAKDEPAKLADKPAEKTALADAAEPNREVTPVAEAKPVIEPKPVVEAKPADEANAGSALPDQMGQDNVRRVKQATAYLRVTMPNGQIAEGSGFFALEPGIVITNAHVLGMLKAGSPPPKNVDVVVYSGEANETKMTGEVLGADRDNDLAVVRVPVSKSLPAPLAIEDDKQLYETQNVYIFGFPFGERLGKNITVSPSAISSLRKDANGALEQIQVNGGMNPGNSGGPVVNSLGRLIGVSVAIISGTQINFAIPANQVKMIVDGRCTEIKMGEPFAQAGQPRLPVQLKCLDPFKRIRDLRIEVWTGKPGPDRPHAFIQPTAQAGDSARQAHTVAYRDGAASMEVPLPQLKPGDVYWVQPVLTTAKGAQWGLARATAADVAVLERVPANLTITFSMKERTSQMTSLYATTFTDGKRKKTFTDKTDAELLEVIALEDQKGKQIARITTVFGALGITFATDGIDTKKDDTHKRAEGVVRGMAPVFVIDANNDTVNYITVALKPGNPLKKIVDDFNLMVHNPYEAATIRMPNKTVQPQESFPAKSTFMVKVDGKAIFVDLMMTCTYEGKRSRASRDEAVMTVTGKLQGRKELKDKITGDITGKVAFDLAGGFLSFTQIKVVTEYDTQIGTTSLTKIVQNDITVSRSAGNPKNLQLAKRNDPPPAPAAKQPAPSAPNAAGNGAEYAPKNKRFTIMMPAGNQRQDTKIFRLGKSAMPVEVCTVQNGPTFTAASIGVPALAMRQIAANKRFETFRDLMIAQAKGKVTGEASLIQGRLAGKDYQIQYAGGAARMQMYMDGGFVFYAIVDVKSKDELDTDNVKAFFASFKMTREVAEGQTNVGSPGTELEFAL